MAHSSRPVRVRMAPSPTGYFHLGSARSALYNWLYARHSDGTFILRIEDTDQTRFVPDSLQDIVDSLRWLGLEWDEGPEVGGAYGPYFQSQRLSLYHEWADWLVRNGHAYRCYCSEERLEALRREQQARREDITGYDRRCRYLTPTERAGMEAAGTPSVVRFAMPLEGTVVFTDLLRKVKPFENSQVRDPVLLKSDGFPTYHLANVVDDHFMEITHVLRGDEWLNSLPLHVNMYRALDWEIPVYAHLPLILDPSGVGKLSKRKKRKEGVPTPLTYVHEYRYAGYLPEAMLNFLAVMGWSYSPDTDLFTREEAIAAFDIKDINPAAGALPLSKLDWMNGHYIRALELTDLGDRLLPFLSEDLDISIEQLRHHPALPVLVPLIQERITTLRDAAELVDFVFTDEISYDPVLLIAKGLNAEQSLAALQAARRLIGALPFSEEALDMPLRGLAAHLGLKPGQLFGILRVAITGKTVAPPLFGSMVAVGRERTLARCAKAETLLQALAPGAGSQERESGAG
jgi:glutamyl-tRNA synthetase